MKKSGAKRVLKKAAKIDSIEKLAVLVAEGFTEQDERFDRIDVRFDRLEARVSNIETDIRAMRHELLGINRRLDRLEELGAPQEYFHFGNAGGEQKLGASNAGFAKEIDDLRSRVRTLETALAKRR